MSKDKISDYSTTASNNTDIAGIGTQGSNLASNFDNAFRTMMKQLADMNAGTSPIFDTFTLCDPADATKRVRIDAGNVATGQTRVLTMPNSDVSLPPYEKGTWTPELRFSGSATGITYANREGRYLRVGKLVIATGYIVLTSKGGLTGPAAIVGLPYPTDFFSQPVTITYWSNMASVAQLGGYLDVTNIFLTQAGVSSSIALTEANFTNTSYVLFTATYISQASDV